MFMTLNDSVLFGLLNIIILLITWIINNKALILMISMGHLFWQVKNEKFGIFKKDIQVEKFDQVLNFVE